MTTSPRRAFWKEWLLSSSKAATWLLNRYRRNPTSVAGSASVLGTKDRGTHVRVARFTNSGERIETATAYTNEVSYFAISHVWGDAAWRTLTCLDREVFVSARKKRFIEEKLYDIVGEAFFWMDVLVLDQRDENQVIATVPDVPKIFMGAERTIAVREGDGLYTCCTEAIETAHSTEDIRTAVFAHLNKTRGSHLSEELYLQRFWPLEEVLVSHTVQFTTCVSDLSELDQHFGKDPKSRTRKNIFDNVYLDETRRILDLLWCLGISFTSGEVTRAGRTIDQALCEFLQAYISCGTVTRPKDAVTGAFADPLSPEFQDLFAYSERGSSKPRDYILALMTQHSWYRFPSDAKRMTFNEIFQDLDRQARQAMTGFACRVTQSMTSNCPVETAWAPSSDLPEPMCLGDFVLLLGNPLDQPPRANLPGPMHLVTLVAVTDPPEACDDQDEGGFGTSEGSSDSFEGSTSSLEHSSESSDGEESLSIPFLDTIQAAMDFSPQAWNFSERAGELTKHGSWPEAPFSNRIRPWLERLEKAKDRSKGDDRIRAIEMIEEKINEESEKENRWASDEQFVIQEAMKSLSLMFGASPMSEKTQRAKGDWRVYMRERNGEWPIQLRQMMLLLAAMIGCKLPLSAARWAKQRLSPVIVWLDEHENKCLGLLSKSYYDTLVSRDSQKSFNVFLASRGYSDPNRGKDIVILDPVTKAPVGLVPDFTHVRLERDEWDERMTLLYGRLFAPGCDCGKGHFAFIALDNLDRVDSSAEIHSYLSRTEESSIHDGPLRRFVKQSAHMQDS